MRSYPLQILTRRILICGLCSVIWLIAGWPAAESQAQQKSTPTAPSPGDPAPTDSAPSPDRSLKLPELSFGVFPFLAASHLEQGFAPLVGQLQEKLGQTIHYRSTRDYSKFMELLDQGAFDLAYIQPFDYVQIAVDQGYRPLARRNAPSFVVFVVNPRSPARNLDDLRGKTLGLPSEMAAISYVGRGVLKELGLDQSPNAVQIRHFRTHDSCLQQLLVHNVDACGVGNSTVLSFEELMDVQLREIAQSASIPSSVIVGHPRLGDDHLKRIQTILHQMEQTPATARILGLAENESLSPALDSEYDPVRKIWTALVSEPNS